MKKQKYYVVDQYIDKVTPTQLYGQFDIPSTKWFNGGIYYTYHRPSSTYFTNRAINACYVFKSEKLALEYVLKRNEEKQEALKNEQKKLILKHKKIVEKIKNTV